MGSLIAQTHAGAVVAMAEVKNCGASERERVKNCKRSCRIAKIAGIAKIARI